MTNIGRRKFLGSSVGAFGLLSQVSGQGMDKGNKPGKKIILKGSQNSLVTHWDIITIGNLSRNRYWGESDEKPIHKAICTCVVVSGKDFKVLIDPSLVDEAEMTTELRRRTGLTPDNIDVVFITHYHGDHVFGLKHFHKARWIAGEDTASRLNKTGQFAKNIETAENRIFDAIDVIPTPGHCPDHHSLRFDYRNLSVLIAGDSVATKDFWDEKTMYYNVIDLEESKRTFEKIDSIADIIVPGHDNVFFNL